MTTPVTTWAGDDLFQIGHAEELEIPPRRRNGTLRPPVPIWVVRAGEAIHEGRVRAGGVEKDVIFADVDTAGTVHDAIDAAYHTKYRRSASDVPPMVRPQARAATPRLVPRIDATTKEGARHEDRQEWSRDHGGTERLVHRRGVR